MDGAALQHRGGQIGQRVRLQRFLGLSPVAAVERPLQRAQRLVPRTGHRRAHGGQQRVGHRTQLLLPPVGIGAVVVRQRQAAGDVHRRQEIQRAAQIVRRLRRPGGGVALRRHGEQRLVRRHRQIDGAPGEVQVVQVPEAIGGAIQRIRIKRRVRLGGVAVVDVHHVVRCGRLRRRRRRGDTGYPQHQCRRQQQERAPLHHPPCHRMASS